MASIRDRTTDRKIVVGEIDNFSQFEIVLENYTRQGELRVKCCGRNYTDKGGGDPWQQLREHMAEHGDGLVAASPPPVAASSPLKKKKTTKKKVYRPSVPPLDGKDSSPADSEIEDKGTLTPAEVMDFEEHDDD